jgi:uncharacterized protein (DUF1499 family)
MAIVIVIVSIIAFLGASIFMQNKSPKIQLGLEDGRLKEIPSKPNCVSSQTKQEEKKVDELNFKGSLSESKEAMKKALNAYGGIVIKEDKEDYLYAVATTGKMKFHDDIEIHFDKKKSKVHYRSASRAGYSDMGLNRQRYDAIAKSYNK